MMNDEALEIEASAAEASNEEVLEDTSSISSDVALENFEVGISDLEIEADNSIDNSSDNVETELRAEISRLRAEIEGISDKKTAFLAEIKEFSEIFGASALSEIPESVWQSASEGVPLAAAYALYEKKETQRAERTALVNKKNSSMSAGAVKNATTSGFFSPAEVKAMSAKEVKKNYNRIIESMKKWN